MNDGVASDTTTTNRNGEFTFNDIMVGQYTIMAQQGIFEFSGNEMVCQVAWPKGKTCTGFLEIRGFDVFGRLMNHEQPLPNFRVELWEEDQEKSYQTSGSDGRFEFKSVPLGNYTLHFKIQQDSGDLSILEIEPEQVGLQVTGLNVDLV